MIKNFPKETVCEYTKEIEVLKGQVVSKTLAQNDHVSLTLFAFDTDEEISSHKSNGDALVYIIEGEANITIDNQEYHLKGGQSILMPALKPHALKAIKPFKMLLTVIF